MKIKIINPKISNSGKSMNFQAEDKDGWFYVPIRFTDIKKESDIERYVNAIVEISEDRYRVDKSWTRVEGFEKINGVKDTSITQAFRKIGTFDRPNTKSKKNIVFKETLIEVEKDMEINEIHKIIKLYAVENNLDMRYINGILMIKDPDTNRFCKFDTFIIKYITYK